jgi:hypothetical protein
MKELNKSLSVTTVLRTRLGMDLYQVEGGVNLVHQNSGAGDRILIRESFYIAPVFGEKPSWSPL